jgi:hypothetical protein
MLICSMLPCQREYNPAKVLLALPLEVNAIEQKYILSSGRRYLYGRRRCSRTAIRFQMAGDCRRLAGSNVAKRGRLCHSCVSCA